jgi:hypothetical protein
MAEINAQDFATVNMVLNRLARRTSKSITGLLSPSLIFINKPTVLEDLLVARQLLHIPGVLTKFGCTLSGVTKDQVATLTFTLTEGEMLKSKMVKITSENFSGYLNLAVETLATLDILINDTCFKDILITLSYIPNLVEYNVTKYLYDDIEVSNQ